MCFPNSRLNTFHFDEVAPVQSPQSLANKQSRTSVPSQPLQALNVPSTKSSSTESSVPTLYDEIQSQDLSSTTLPSNPETLTTLYDETHRGIRHAIPIAQASIAPHASLVIPSIMTLPRTAALLSASLVALATSLTRSITSPSQRECRPELSVRMVGFRGWQSPAGIRPLSSYL